MNTKGNPVIGIVGGMGPQAGLALFNSILCRTNARKDQDHLSVILMSFPGDIGDRTLFLENRQLDNPAFRIAGVIKKLEDAGADLIGIACNTSYSPEIYNVVLEEMKRSGSRAKLLHMPAETCDHLKSHFPGVQRVGVLTTNGTYQSGIYSDLLKSHGYSVIMPPKEFQAGIIHRLIYDEEYGLKANPRHITGEAKIWYEKAMHFFKDHGAEAIILGCTDLTVLVEECGIFGIPVIDSTECMAMALIREACV
jgi:aspartate racemase